MSPIEGRTPPVVVQVAAEKAGVELSDVMSWEYQQEKAQHVYRVGLRFEDREPIAMTVHDDDLNRVLGRR